MPGTRALFFSAADMFLVFLFGALLDLDAALGVSLGLDAVAPDLMASPMSFCAFGAGAATSSSSSSSESLLIEGLPITLAVVVLTLFFFLSWPTASSFDSMVNFRVSPVATFLGLEVGTLLAGTFFCIPGFVATAEPYSFLSTFFFEVASSSSAI